MNAKATAININVIFRSAFFCRCRFRVEAEPRVKSAPAVLLDVTIER